MENVHEPVVVPLAWRNKKTPPTTHRVERMTYPELSADVLHLIAEYLSFSDRLNLSLVSKAFHSIVYQITELVCSDAVQLSRLREYLYADPVDRVRGRRLVSLSLHFMTLPKPGDEYGTQCLTMLLEVLQRTTNLRRLSIDNDSRWTEVFSRDPLRGILSRLYSLAYLRVEAPIQEYILNPGLYPTSLRKVHLSAHDGRVLAFQALCRVLGQLASLEELTLESFPENNSAYLDTRDGITVLKSIRKLTLISTWLPLGSPQSLPAIFPGVHTMTLIHCDLNTPSWTTYEYPSLHRVHCHYDTRSRLEYVVNFPYDVRVMSIVIRRQDDFMVSVPNPATMVGMVFRAPCTWWNVQSSCRWSQFECIDKNMAETLSLLTSQLLCGDTPKDQQLFLMSILARRPNLDAPGNTSQQDRLDEVEKVRETFLKTVSGSVHSLRYIALAEVSEVALDWPEDYTRNGTHRRWWRIVRDDDGVPREVREIPEWEGERVRVYVENAKTEDIDRFDESFVAMH